MVVLSFVLITISSRKISTYNLKQYSSKEVGEQLVCCKTKLVSEKGFNTRLNICRILKTVFLSP